MSEFLHNTPDERKTMLKEILLRLHQGEQPETLKRQLSTLLHTIPYQLGSVRSAIRELFEYGKKRAAIVDRKSVV